MKLQQKVDTDPKCHQKRCLKLSPDHPQSRYHVCAVANPIWRQELEKGLLKLLSNKFHDTLSVLQRFSYLGKAKYILFQKLKAHFKTVRIFHIANMMVAQIENKTWM